MSALILRRIRAADRDLALRPGLPLARHARRHPRGYGVWLARQIAVRKRIDARMRAAGLRPLASVRVELPADHEVRAECERLRAGRRAP